MSDTSNVNSIDDYRAGRRAVSKLSTDLESISQALEVYEEGGDNWTPSFTYGYLDGISLKLQHLIDEVEAEKIPVTTNKEEETNDGSGREGDRDNSGEDGEEADGGISINREKLEGYVSDYKNWRDCVSGTVIFAGDNTDHDGCSTDPGSETSDI